MLSLKRWCDSKHPFSNSMDPNAGSKFTISPGISKTYGEHPLPRKKTPKTYRVLLQKNTKHVETSKKNFSSLPHLYPRYKSAPYIFCPSTGVNMKVGHPPNLAGHSGTVSAGAQFAPGKFWVQNHVQH